MKCFVIMPFGNPLQDPDKARKLELIYSQWIKPSVEAVLIENRPDEKLVCHRADKEFRPQEIISHIIENLVTADIVIADLSDKNANVFYELGVRHAVNNNTILIAENIDDIPFDLRGLRTIVYKYEPEHMLRLKDSLGQAIKEIFKEPSKIDNPVRRFLYDQEVNKLIKQPIPPGYDVVKSIVTEMSSLKKEFCNHVNEVRNILKLITTTEPKQFIPNITQKHNLKFFEGTWKSDSGSTYCARVVNGELLMPYCYMGDSELTGHYYNCKFIGETLFCRFRWFNGEYSGYSFFKIETPAKLVGGWWLKEDVPSEISADHARISELLPGMRKHVFKRTAKEAIYFSWAEAYFKEVQVKAGRIIYKNSFGDNN